MLDSVCDVNREVYFLGDLNIDWFSSSCQLKRKLLTLTSACNLVQVINQPTRVFTNTTGTRSSTCFDHIFTNTVELCSKAVSVPIGCNDHNIVAISRKAKVPTAGPKKIYICWSDVIHEEPPDAALDEFMKLLPIIDKHAPVKKLTVRTVKAP